MKNYLTPQEADEKIKAYLMSADPARLAWEKLDDNDKEVCIAQATARIEALPYTGVPASGQQEGAFPRNGESEISEEVKAAIALEACACCNAEANTRIAMQAQGVKSFSVGNLSESYKLGANVEKLYSPTAHQLLAKYLRGAHLCL